MRFPAAPAIILRRANGLTTDLTQKPNRQPRDRRDGNQCDDQWTEISQIRHSASSGEVRPDGRKRRSSRRKWWREHADPDRQDDHHRRADSVHLDRQDDHHRRADSVHPDRLGHREQQRPNKRIAGNPSSTGAKNVLPEYS